MSAIEHKHKKRKGSVVTRGRKALFNALGQVRLKRKPALWTRMQEAEALTASTGCNYSEYWWLYNFVVTRRPRYILECGAGISTVVMGFAIRELSLEGHEPPRLISMENVPYYYDNLRKLIPAEIEPFIEINLSDVKDVEFHCGMGRCYTEIPEHPYEFVFTDGPNLPREASVPYFDCDYINVVKKTERNVTGVLDSRRSTRAAYQQLLSTARQKKLRNAGFYYIDASQSDLHSVE